VSLRSSPRRTSADSRLTAVRPTRPVKRLNSPRFSSKPVAEQAMRRA
jgi:hypothetical protein